MDRQELGALGEELAAQFLVKHGYELLARNLKSRYGEIDLLARQAKVLVIVEVKTKSNLNYGQAVEMITAHKYAKLRLLAQQVSRQYNQVDYRIDIIAIDWSQSQPKLEHIIGV